MKPFSCPICKKLFATKNSKYNHYTIVHKNAGSFKCQCGKTFGARTTLAIHQRSHTGEKPFSCKVCNNRFVSKGSLKYHHSEIHLKTNFKCHRCDLVLGNEENLKNHLLVHPHKKRTFGCEKCPKRFTRKYNLQRHHLNCHAEKKFKCPQCEMVFGRETILKDHFVVHSGHRPFKCDQCEKSFKYNKNLKVHLARHSIRQHHLALGQRRPAVVRVKPSESSQALNGGQYSRIARRKRSSYWKDQEQSTEESDDDNESGWARNNEMTSVDSDDAHGNQELPQESNTVTSTNLKLVFDVQYEAPE